VAQDSPKQFVSVRASGLRLESLIDSN
jgi:hypothetical protein